MERPEKRITYPAKPTVEGQQIHGELEKTVEDETMITLAIDLLKEYLTKNGVEKVSELDPERIHIFYERQFSKQSRDHRASIGLYHPKTSRIDVVKKTNRLETLFTMIHELTHEAGIRKWSHVIGAKAQDTLYRSGYAVEDSQSVQKNIEASLHFQAFDEGVVENISVGTLTRGRERVAELYRLPHDHSYEEMVAACVTYHDATLVVADITRGLAEYQQRDMSVVWATIVQGEVTGNMMWMRGIDTAFGEGSLRVLDRLVADPQTDAEQGINRKVIDYFACTDHEARMRLQSEIY